MNCRDCSGEVAFNWMIFKRRDGGKETRSNVKLNFFLPVLVPSGFLMSPSFKDIFSGRTKGLLNMGRSVLDRNFLQYLNIILCRVDLRDQCCWLFREFVMQSANRAANPVDGIFNGNARLTTVIL